MAALLKAVKPPSTLPTTPIVFLLGWGGAKEKQLMKYVEIYEQKGFEVVGCITPFGLSGRSLVAYEKFAIDLHERALLPLQKTPDLPVFFHVFSMNGLSVFTKTWDLLDEKDGGKEFKSRVRGLVIDSGPADTTPYTSSIAFSTAAFPPATGVVNAMGRTAMFVGLFFYLSFCRLVQWLRYAVGDREIFEREICFYRMLQLKDLPRKQLFLYSKRDTTIRFFDVDRFAAHQQQLGVEVKQKCWPDSPHVQHFRKHPVEYTRLCHEFVDDCLSRRPQ